MHDGVDRDLKQVRYVLEFKRNLISLGVIDQSGFIIKEENGELQFIKNDIVIMKKTRRNGLYVLKGFLFSLGIMVAVNRDKTKLWHMRLAHISENGLKELSKQGLFGYNQISSLEFCEKCVFGKATRQKFSTEK